MSNIRVRAAALLKNQRNELLLLQHQKEGHRYWVLPGGGVHYLETVPRGLEREMQEELNIQVLVRQFLFMNESIYPDRTRHILNLYFSVEYTGGKMKLSDDKRLFDYAYFPASAISDLLIYPALNNVLVEYLRNGFVQVQYQQPGWIT